MLKEVLSEAAESAVFGFLCILDGVRVIEDVTDKGTLELYFVKSGEKTQLNDPSREEPHNLFNSVCSMQPAANSNVLGRSS